MSSRSRLIHTFPALALYRALLSQVDRIWLDDAKRNALRETIQFRFWRNRVLRKDFRHINLQFVGGYAALDVLDAAAEGDKTSLSRIQSFLKSHPPPADWPKKDRRAKQLRKVARRENLPPKAPSIFDRFPRPTVKGIRKVPQIVNAGNIPFLRYKKPQPESVSRVIRTMIFGQTYQMYRQRTLEEFYIPLAEHEDIWDRIVEKTRGCSRSEGGGEKWQSVYRTQNAEVGAWFKERNKNLRETARKLSDIVEAEQALAEKEAEERRRQALQV
ncbi:hypothetical protein P152DRAFT_445337 [Eremomyces bilateralis CBS 781.70]|uniref:Uncharacterized protein n=1 Tax=Eremomyces bilateralis CBS 781.70 TaxID=1392243 RepID=A0A6G1GGN4_9PEZI|nr:uncharacterized protein P152DRAFT_445337 [Eremomyces bilateralis CBS 781.70]KAF1817213.1 hypothetical protein P152DRAFT_445337 [Eremomyces bilateralis CBS 781.70]